MDPGMGLGGGSRRLVRRASSGVPRPDTFDYDLRGETGPNTCCGIPAIPSDRTDPTDLTDLTDQCDSDAAAAVDQLRNAHPATELLCIAPYELETMMTHRYEKEQAVAIRAVRAAARLCRAVRESIAPDVLAKKDKSPVTVADFGSQALICRALAEAFSFDPVIAEEDAAELRLAENSPILEQVLDHVRAMLADDVAAGVTREDVCRWIDHGCTRVYCDRFWTLDPIDGTKGFLRKEQYAVALALIVGGELTVAALACPGLPAQAGVESGQGSIYSAVRGQGAFVEVAESIGGMNSSPRRISVSSHDDPAVVRFCESVESGHSAQGDSAAVAAALGVSSPPLRMDSQAKYAVVARGEADLYLRLPTSVDYREKIWDHAAGALIVAEAGGAVTDIHGRPLEFNHGRELTANRGVVVSNGRFHDRVIAAVQMLGIGPDARTNAADEPMSG
jgi:3'(2'), 5'-bisphosphate nucleotidase